MGTAAGMCVCGWVGGWVRVLVGVFCVYIVYLLVWMCFLFVCICVYLLVCVCVLCVCVVWVWA